MNNIKERIKIFSGAQLKYIAFLSMLIDHTNKALIYPNLDGGALNRLSDFFDILGRIAFPIFIFLLVEGYFHTSTKWRYLVTLLVFGVISEVPFDMCTSARFVEINWNNIMFTLALVLAMIWVIDVLKERWRHYRSLVVFRIISHCSGVVHCSNECKSGLRTSCGTDRLFLLYFS